jgi:hypothetical protein
MKVVVEEAGRLQNGTVSPLILSVSSSSVEGTRGRTRATGTACDTSNMCRSVTLIVFMLSGFCRRFARQIEDNDGMPEKEGKFMIERV